MLAFAPRSYFYSRAQSSKVTRYLSGVCGQGRLRFWDGRPGGSCRPLGGSVPAPGDRAHLASAREGGRCSSGSCPRAVCPHPQPLSPVSISPGSAGAGAGPCWGRSGEESPVALKSPRCLILKKSPWYLLACLGQVSPVMGCVCTVRACLEESEGSQNQPNASVPCI